MLSRPASRTAPMPARCCCSSLCCATPHRSSALHHRCRAQLLSPAYSSSAHQCLINVAFRPSSPCLPVVPIAVVARAGARSRSTPATVPTPFIDRPPFVEPHRNSRPTVRTHRRNYVVRRRRDRATHQPGPSVPRLTATKSLHSPQG
jgi:hypothetical protein